MRRSRLPLLVSCDAIVPRVNCARFVRCHSAR